MTKKINNLLISLKTSSRNSILSSQLILFCLKLKNLCNLYQKKFYHDVSRILSKLFSLHPSLSSYIFVSDHDSSRTSSSKNTFLNKQKSTCTKSSSSTLPSLFFILSFTLTCSLIERSTMGFLLMEQFFNSNVKYLNLLQFNGCRELSY